MPPKNDRKITETAEIADSTPEIISFGNVKLVLARLSKPAELRDHPLTRCKFVARMLAEHPELRRNDPGEQLGVILEHVWRRHCNLRPTKNPNRARWNRFLVLEVAYFQPFIRKERPPVTQPEIGSRLAAPIYLAEIIANGDEVFEQQLRSEIYQEFWEALMRNSQRRDPENRDAKSTSSVGDWQKWAINELVKVVSDIEAATDDETPLAQAQVVEANADFETSDDGPEATDLYLTRILPKESDYMPDEWNPIINLAISKPRLILHGSLGTGKTQLLQVVGHVLQQLKMMPLFIDLAEYAPYAAKMDLLRFAAVYGPFARLHHDAARCAAFERSLGTALYEDRLVVLADRADALLEHEIEKVSERLNELPRFVATERTERLRLDRSSVVVQAMPNLSTVSLLEIVRPFSGKPIELEAMFEQFRQSDVEVVPALARFCVEALPTWAAPHPLSVLNRWITVALGQTRSTGALVAEQDKARRLLRYLAGIRVGIAPHPQLTTALVHDNVRRAFREPSLQLDQEDQGWALVEFCTRSGLLERVDDHWQFAVPGFESVLAAEYAYFDGEWVSLSPQHRVFMRQVAALAAHQSPDYKQQAFFERLSLALDLLSDLSALDAADLFVEFRDCESPYLQAFKADVIGRLTALSQIDSLYARRAVKESADRLGLDLGLPDKLLSPISIVQPDELAAYAQDLPTLLQTLRLTVPNDNEARCLADKRVIEAFIDCLLEDYPQYLRLQCAAWLQRAPLSTQVNVEIGGVVYSGSALTIMADAALGKRYDGGASLLAKSVLTNDQWITQICALGEAYLPLAYDLLLFLNKRLRRPIAGLPGSTWEVIS